MGDATPRQKLAVIAGGTLLSWGLVGLFVWMLVSVCERAF